MGIFNAISKGAQHIDDFLSGISQAASKNADDAARVLGSSNKYVDEVAETLRNSNGNKVLDEAVYSMDDAVKSGNRAGKMKKADIAAKKAEIKARMEARANGEEVKYSGNLGGVNEGSRGLYRVTDNNIDYVYDGKSWKQAKYNVGSNDKPSAVFYDDVNVLTSDKLNKKFLTEPSRNLHESGLKDNMLHNQRQEELESVWTPRTQDDLDKANRGWRQRTLDGAQEKASNAWDHISGNHRRRTTEQRRAYNQRVFDSGEGNFINTNREYKQMQQQYANSNADTAETLYENMINAQRISQTQAGEHSGINLGDFLGNHPVIGLGGAAVGGGIIANILDDDE